MLKNRKGMILVAVYLVIAVLLVLGGAFMSRSISENRLARREKDAINALSIAEAGIERALYDLKQDFVLDTVSPSWRDGDINGNAIGPDNDDFYLLPYDDNTLGDGSYSVELRNVTGEVGKIRVKSTGTYESVTKTIQIYAQMKSYSPWNTAVFAGVGTSGSVINGNVDIRGSVHILGEEAFVDANSNGVYDAGETWTEVIFDGQWGEAILSTQTAISMSGSANVGNNYQGIPSALGNRIPASPTVIFNGESVESLGAEVRIKNGLAGLSGSATIGDSDNPGDSYKETVDAVYVSDGYGGSKGAGNVYSDNGTTNSYDLGNTVRFPSLTDPYQSYATYQDYLKSNALVIDNPAQLGELNNLTPDSNFSYSDGTNTIAIDGNGNLTISGIVYIDGGGLNMDEGGGGMMGGGMMGGNDTITYSGQGTIFATGNVGINVNLLTPNSTNSFPDNILGIMTPGDIEFDQANIDVMGAFYAEGKIEVKKQTNVAGTLVANYFNLLQVPSIYQIPDLFDNLPAGMICLNPAWSVEVVAWQEIEI